jgi:nicotinate-nucleotide adenylyltransferase
MSRSSAGQGATVFGGKPFEDYLQSRISEGYRLSASQSSYVHEEKKPVFIFDVTPVDISSTKIRKLIKTGRPIKSLVPEIVEAFIKSKGLYL